MPNKNFIFCSDDGWLLNVAKCNYIRPRTKEENGKKKHQIVFNFGNNNDVTSTFDTQKLRDKALEEIKSHLSFMDMDERC